MEANNLVDIKLTYSAPLPIESRNFQMVGDAIPARNEDFPPCLHCFPNTMEGVFEANPGGTAVEVPLRSKDHRDIVRITASDLVSFRHPKLVGFVPHDITRHLDIHLSHLVECSDVWVSGVSGVSRRHLDKLRSHEVIWDTTLKGASPVHDIAFYHNAMKFMDIVEPHNPIGVLRQI
ncbi:hypothetical protein Scep_017286 [Stephania cephalantha]|uniref:Uncharacterized protein n=1 Tax=Stephania cephalantha TaxID=152367 RepID=A0AAP0IQL9_9MAGN